MSREREPFYDRIRQIQRQHRQLAKGYSLTVDQNNLIVPQPQYVTVAFPWRALCIAVLVALGLKAYLMAAMDAQTYASKLDALARGHAVEQVGAWMMQPDPASGAVAQVIRMMRG